MERKYFPDRMSNSLRKQEFRLVQAASDQEQEAKQVDKSKTAPPPTTETVHRKTKVAEKGEKLKKDLDKIIDEIDEVLEENAEEFIRSYVQRGGE